MAEKILDLIYSKEGMPLLRTTDDIDKLFQYFSANNITDINLLNSVCPSLRKMKLQLYYKEKKEEYQRQIKKKKTIAQNNIKLTPEEKTKLREVVDNKVGVSFSGKFCCALCGRKKRIGYNYIIGSKVYHVCIRCIDPKSCVRRPFVRIIYTPMGNKR